MSVLGALFPARAALLAGEAAFARGDFELTAAALRRWFSLRLPPTALTLTRQGARAAELLAASALARLDLTELRAVAELVALGDDPATRRARRFVAWCEAGTEGQLDAVLADVPEHGLGARVTALVALTAAERLRGERLAESALARVKTLVPLDEPALLARQSALRTRRDLLPTAPLEPPALPTPSALALGPEPEPASLPKAAVRDLTLSAADQAYLARQLAVGRAREREALYAWALLLGLTALGVVGPSMLATLLMGQTLVIINSRIIGLGAAFGVAGFRWFHPDYR